MTKQLDDLHDQYPRADQEIKIRIGEYIFHRPGRWIPRKKIVEQFDIDESGVSRHLSALHVDEFLITKIENDQRYVQWNGRGAGGIVYWIRQAVPPQLWAAGSELRPLLTLDSLGGAYVPTLFFGGLILTGFITAIFALIIVYLPSDSALGVTVTEVVVLTGIVTIMASFLMLAIPIARLVEVGWWKAWKWVSGSLSNRQ